MLIERGEAVEALKSALRHVEELTVGEERDFSAVRDCIEKWENNTDDDEWPISLSDVFADVLLASVPLKVEVTYSLISHVN